MADHARPLLTIGCTAALLAASVSSHATLVPVGETFLVESVESLNAVAPRVAIDATGGFRVAWMSYVSELTGWDVYSRIFDGDAVALGEEAEVTNDPSGYDDSPSIAINDAGDYLVSWTAEGPAFFLHNYARIFDAQGTPKGDAFALDELSASASQWAPSAAGDGDGFVVAWLESDRIAGVRLDSSGDALGDFSFAVQEPQHVAVDRLPGGNAVAVWSSSTYTYVRHDTEGPIGNVDGAIFDATGELVEDFRVNDGRDDPSGYGFVVDGEWSVSVSSDALGAFTVSHDSNVPRYVYNADELVDETNLGAKAERFVGAVSQGSFFLAPTPSDALTSDVARTPGGNTLAVYHGNGIQLRALDCHGADASDGLVEVEADQMGVVHFRQVSVAVNEAGNVVVVWSQDDVDGYGRIVGRRFQLEGGCALCGDADANGRLSAADALIALRASVGSMGCAGNRCDTDASQTITPGDALRILIAAVAGATDLACGMP